VVELLVQYVPKDRCKRNIEIKKLYCAFVDLEKLLREHLERLLGGL